MMKSVMAGAAAVLLLAGTASAQAVYRESTTKIIPAPGVSEETTTKSVTPTETDGDFHASTTVRKKNGDGTTTEATKKFTAGANGTKSNTSFKATAPDGSEVTGEREKVTTPSGATSTTETTTEIKP